MLIRACLSLCTCVMVLEQAQWPTAIAVEKLLLTNRLMNQQNAVVDIGSLPEAWGLSTICVHQSPWWWRWIWLWYVTSRSPWDYPIRNWAIWSPIADIANGVKRKCSPGRSQGLLMSDFRLGWSRYEKETLAGKSTRFTRNKAESKQVLRQANVTMMCPVDAYVQETTLGFKWLMGWMDFCKNYVCQPVRGAWACKISESTT